MLNSVLLGPSISSSEPRHYVAALAKAAGPPPEVSALLGRWGVSRQIYVAATDAEALAEPGTPRCGTRSRSAAS